MVIFFISGGTLSKFKRKWYHKRRKTSDALTTVTPYTPSILVLESIFNVCLQFLAQEHLGSLPFYSKNSLSSRWNWHSQHINRYCGTIPTAVYKIWNIIPYSIQKITLMQTNKQTNKKNRILKVIRLDISLFWCLGYAFEFNKIIFI